MTTNQRILITAALPYANGPIHLGHLAGAYVPADLYARYQRLKGRDVLFICGSDEHGVPITLKAEKEGVTPQAIVDRYHALNKASFAQFGMSFDNYSRTTLPVHHATAQEFFLSYYKRKLLKEKKTQQLYDEKAGMFLPDRYVEGTCPVCGNPDARGDQCEKCGTYLDPMQLINPRSKVTGTTPVVRETTHLYFPFGEFQERLERYINDASERDGWKENVLQYCRSWFKDGLEDRSYTRDLDWGVRVPLPGYENKVLYVWFDAVLGYISGSKEWSAIKGEPDAWRRYWCDPQTKYVAFIGKDNIVFHCIVFPAMLMAWNDTEKPTYILPANVPANEFLNFEGQKFSKSRGWGVYLQEVMDHYPADALRYYMSVTLPEYRDSDFTWREFQAKYNNELADILGNFINRTLAFTTRTFKGTVPQAGPLNALDQGIVDVMARTPAAAGQCFEQYHFKDGVVEVMNLARAANKYFNDAEPWKSAKQDPERCATTIHISLQIVRALAVLSSPFVPFAAEKTWRMLGLEGEAARQLWDDAGNFGIPAGHRLGTPEILFTKIEDAMIEEELKKLGVPEGAAVTAAPAAPETPKIPIEEFQKVQLRVARVLECVAVPKSKKLLKMQVDLGTEKRQIVAGIAQHYTPEQMVGTLVVVVANLQPATLMGQESQGMLLAASDTSGALVVVRPSGDIAPGSVVK